MKHDKFKPQGSDSNGIKPVVQSSQFLPTDTITVEEALERIDYLITDWKMSINRRSFDIMKESILKRFPTTRTR